MPKNIVNFFYMSFYRFAKKQSTHIITLSVFPTFKNGQRSGSF